MDKAVSWVVRKFKGFLPPQAVPETAAITIVEVCHDLYLFPSNSGRVLFGLASFALLVSPSYFGCRSAAAGTQDPGCNSAPGGCCN